LILGTDDIPEIFLVCLLYIFTCDEPLVFHDKVERLLWFGAFIAVVWLGDGSNNIWVVLLRDSETKRSWFILALSSLAINFGILCYLIFYHDFHRRGSKWETRAKWALPVSCFFGAVTFIGFCLILWPTYGWSTPAVEVVIFIGMLMLSYLVPHAKTKSKKHAFKTI
jgi:hypothetical protein